MSNTINVLIIDDEKSLRDFVKRNLEIRSYRTFNAANGLEGLAIFTSQTIDLVILDLMMPKMDGLEVIRQIRSRSLVPIIILSALGEETEKIQAFNLGADDYLTKPFGIGELLARLQAVLRRTQWQQTTSEDGMIIRGDFVVDLDQHQILVRGASLDLTPTEYNMLVYLIEHADKVLTHQLLLHNVWGSEYGEENEYIRVYVGKLRQKIEIDPTKPKHLITERGIGYSFHPNP